MGRFDNAGKTGILVGKVLGKHNMAKPFESTDTTLAYVRNQESIDREAGLEGIYVIITSYPCTRWTSRIGTGLQVSGQRVEDLQDLKSRGLRIRPIHHHTEERIRAHVFLCTLVGHLTWHLRQALASLTFSEEDRPDPAEPVSSMRRSAPAAANTCTTGPPHWTISPCTDSWPHGPGKPCKSTEPPASSKFLPPARPSRTEP